MAWVFVFFFKEKNLIFVKSFNQDETKDRIIQNKGKNTIKGTT
jgi:hypothetical protein